ncbi:MAG: hypothetical protein M1839_009463 [Geoglossum umbratile]|nr:MAG: hypothetical protein M1839_009463 [Geoglossum umbratile]
MAEYRPFPPHCDPHPPLFSLKLTASAQREALPNPQPLVAAILDRAVEGAGANVRVSPLISNPPPEILDQMVARAVCLDPSYDPPDFRAWYRVQLGTAGVDNQFVDRLVRQLNCPGSSDVESFQVLRAAPLRRAPLVPTSASAAAPMPRPIDPKPVGVDAVFAHGCLGGNGGGIGFADLEQSWDLNHVDLLGGTPPRPRVSVIPLDPSGPGEIDLGVPMETEHGTAVLGIVLRQRGGVAPGCKAYVVPDHQPGLGSNLPKAITTAAHSLRRGDVLLIETQGYAPQGSFDAPGGNDISGEYYLPAEVMKENFDPIRLATALGIVVVEAAGNGGDIGEPYNLDTYVDGPTGHQIFKAGPDFQDSGAVIVGAANSPKRDNPLTRSDSSNFGSRVNAFAWGDGIYTTWSDGVSHTGYTGDFGGTSGAAAIIAGAAILLQAIVSKKPGMPPGFRFGPLGMRWLLAQGCTPSHSADDMIGGMPDLHAIITGPYFNAAPDTYIRDAVGDDGARPRPAGLTYHSPDIIVLHSPVVGDPQLVFGAGSQTEDNSMLSEPILGGEPHTIYVRVRNRGAVPENCVSASVYWAPASTTLTPSTWSKIGTTTAVLPGNSLAVSAGLPWTAPPTGGSYCLIAVVSTTLDPAPEHTNFTMVDKFLNFAVSSNKIAARNLDVIPAPLAEGAIHTLSFLVPGYPNRNEVFTLETLGSLPRGSEVTLRLPRTLARQLHVELPRQPPPTNGCTPEEAADAVELALPPIVWRRIGMGAIPAGSVSRCELCVRVPEETYTAPGTHEIGVRQLVGEREVGRFTWRFGQVTCIRGGVRAD